MNTTTKAQREQWIASAARILEMDADTRVTNKHGVIAYLMAEYDCSAASALTALANAIRRKRYAIDHPEQSAAALLGSMTSEKKATASRENGKRGGRPRKETTMKSDFELKNKALESVRRIDKSAESTSAVNDTALQSGTSKIVTVKVFAGNWNYEVAMYPTSGKIEQITRDDGNTY